MQKVILKYYVYNMSISWLLTSCFGREMSSSNWLKYQESKQPTQPQYEDRNHWDNSKLPNCKCNNFQNQLHSMRWFSHRRRTGGRYNCTTYLLSRLPRPHPFVDFFAVTQQAATFLRCGDPGVGLMIPNSNLGEIFVHCIYNGWVSSSYV